MKLDMKVKIILLVFILCVSACKTQNKSSVSADQKVDQALVEKYWKLIELNGSPVAVSDNNEKEAHIILNIRQQIAQGVSFPYSTPAHRFEPRNCLPLRELSEIGFRRPCSDTSSGWQRFEKKRSHRIFLIEKRL